MHTIHRLNFSTCSFNFFFQGKTSFSIIAQQHKVSLFYKFILKYISLYEFVKKFYRKGDLDCNNFKN